MEAVDETTISYSSAVKTIKDVDCRKEHSVST